MRRFSLKTQRVTRKYFTAKNAKVFAKDAKSNKKIFTAKNAEAIEKNAEKSKEHIIT